VERGRRLGADEAFGATPDPDEIVLLGHRSIQRRRLQAVTGIVGESEAMQEALERVVQIAPVDSTVLITGESGTGKELVARGIHALSSRRHKGFLAVNVAALPETLLESELFGHEKGAFTGAIDSRRGFFEMAHRGSLLLDEIGEMPLSTQTKLLRVLEQREFLRVGGEKAIEVDVRIIAATNQDLRSLVPEGRFRRDLYYRINILSIELPPLRNRREDVPKLVHHFVREVTERMDRPFPGISDAAMEILVEYNWPGNVRELRNLVESMVVLSPGREIGPRDIPIEFRSPGAVGRLLPAGRSPAGRTGRDTPGDVVERGERRLRPELEFVFRTLVDLRMDVDQLRREFEVYRDEVEERMDGSKGRPLALPAPREVSEGSNGRLGIGRRRSRGGRSGHRTSRPASRQTRKRTTQFAVSAGHDHGGTGARSDPGGPSGDGWKPEEGGRKPRDRGADPLPEDREVRDRLTRED
jgi:transcriptional regulator with PAS, ATPase and Fis domain